jgi:hypothetical protein
MLAAETSAREAVVAQDSAALHVKDAEDRDALAEREALERVSRAEAENAAVLASAREYAEGFAHKITLLEDKLTAEHQSWEVSERECREQFEELTLLHTQSSELCYAIIGPLRAMHHLFEGMQLAALLHTKMAWKLVML